MKTKQIKLLMDVHAISSFWNIKFKANNFVVFLWTNLPYDFFRLPLRTWGSDPSMLMILAVLQLWQWAVLSTMMSDWPVSKGVDAMSSLLPTWQRLLSTTFGIVAPERKHSFSANFSLMALSTAFEMQTGITGQTVLSFSKSWQPVLAAASQMV